jgi:hypothetical protein
MPLSALTGTRLRERRLALGLRQIDVAGQAGISASYLNLIEHNRRPAGEALLDRLAAALGLDRSALAPGSDAALSDGLRAAVARAPARDAALVELDRLADFIGRFPGWAGLAVALDARAEGLERTVAALNDRMTHDPHLSASLHEVLSTLASVRATAAILAETPDLSPDWAARFRGNLYSDTERLAVAAEALVAYLDQGQAAGDTSLAAPEDEVEAWLQRRSWGASDADLAAVRAGGMPADVASLASTAARSLAARHLVQAAADAAVLPGPDLARAKAAHGPDPFAIAEALAADPLVAMRRLAADPDLGAGLVACDASGTLTFRKPLPGFALPRFGAACPIWPLYAALGRPQTPVDVLIEVAGQAGQRFRAFAWAAPTHALGLRGPALPVAAMLILPAPPRSDGSGALAVGSSCRICPRGGCPARREPSILSDGASQARAQQGF